MSRHSPVIFALLLAATLSVDAVALYWCWRTLPRGDRAAALYLGLVLGQLGVCCIWASLATRRGLWRWLVPYAGGLAAVLGIASTVPRPYVWTESVAALWIFWVHVTLILAALWLVKQTSFGARLADDANRQPWRVSIRQLLMVTTVVALILALWAYADLEGARQIGFIAAWMGSNVGVVVAAALVLSRGRSWILRTATFVGTVVALWLAMYLVTVVAGFNQGKVRGLLSADLIQAAVLVLWLELVPIIPRRAAAGVDTADAAAPPAPAPGQPE